MFRYAEDFLATGHTLVQMYLAIMEFIFTEFDLMKGMEVRAFYAP